MNPKTALDLNPFLLLSVGLAVGLSIAALAFSLARLRGTTLQRRPRWPQAKWIVLPVFGASLLAVCMVWLLYTPVYSATAVVRLSPDSPTIVYKDAKLETPQFPVFVNTEIAVMSGHTVMERVLDNPTIRETQWYKDTSRQTMASGVNGVYERFEEDLSVEPRSGTELIDITFSASRPGDAQKIAEAVVTEYKRLRGDLDKQSDNQIKEILTTEQTTLQMEIDGLIKTRFNSSSRLGTDAPEQLRSVLTQQMSQLENSIHERQRQQEMKEWEFARLQKAGSQPSGAEGTSNLALVSMERERLAREVSLLEKDLVAQRRRVAEAGEVAQDIATQDERIRQKRELYEAVRSRRQQLEIEEKAPARVRQVASAVEPLHPSNDRRPGATLAILAAGACLSLLLLAIRPSDARPGQPEDLTRPPSDV